VNIRIDPPSLKGINRVLPSSRSRILKQFQELRRVAKRSEMPPLPDVPTPTTPALKSHPSLGTPGWSRQLSIVALLYTIPETAVPG
jgi:hypothetical protein